LGPDQPLYGLQSRALDGKTLPLTTIEEMVQVYLEEIQSFYPQGPYLLAGYSMGAFIAFEIAHRLSLAGKKVALLALLDPPEIQIPSLASDHPYKTVSLSKQPLRNHYWLATKQKVMRAILKFHRAFGLPLLPAFRLFPSLRLFNVQEINQKAARQYVADIHYPHKATLFLTHQNKATIPGLEQGWKVVTGEVEVHDIPGCHGAIAPDSFLKEPNVRTLAMHLKASIERDSTTMGTLRSPQ
jgi:pimeloyl-ACP methyl ester carboxylesterase